MDGWLVRWLDGWIWMYKWLLLWLSHRPVISLGVCLFIHMLIWIAVVFFRYCVTIKKIVCLFGFLYECKYNMYIWSHVCSMKIFLYVVNIQWYWRMFVCIISTYCIFCMCFFILFFRTCFLDFFSIFFIYLLYFLWSSFIHIHTIESILNHINIEHIWV